MVQAGDLHSTAGGTDTYRPYLRSVSSTNVGAGAEHNLLSPMNRPVRQAARLTSDDFDLREEVMSCIAKSIGLHQPPLSGNDSVEASPAFPASEAGGMSPKTTLPRTPFGSLSLLETGDDTSSLTGSSVAGTGTNGNISALDNEVEILFFAAGSTLVNAGERHAGLFYVIDGLLDISLPTDEPLDKRHERTEPPHTTKTPFRRTDTAKANVGINPSAKTPLGHKERASTGPERARQHLFTVKPGGIAGYLGAHLTFELFLYR